MNLDETYLGPADDLVRFFRSKVRVTAGCRGGRGINVDTGTSKVHLIVRIEYDFRINIVVWVQQKPTISNLLQA